MTSRISPGAPVIEIETLRKKARRLVPADLEEHLVRLDRVDQAIASGLAEHLRRCIGRTRIVEPQAAFEQGEDLRGEHPALGQQMPGALAPDRDLVGKLGPEQDQSLGIEPAVLDEAERHRLDPRAPGHVGGAFAGHRQRIGEARAVHVEGEAPLLRQLAERRDLRGPVNEPIFGRVGNRDGGGLDLVDVLADAVAARRRRPRA